jgi:hypothetical protein
MGIPRWQSVHEAVPVRSLGGEPELKDPACCKSTNWLDAT